MSLHLEQSLEEQEEVPADKLAIAIRESVAGMLAVAGKAFVADSPSAAGKGVAAGSSVGIDIEVRPIS